MTRRIALEVCVDSPGGLRAAVHGGADRIELCAALALGGLSPSPGLIGRAMACGAPVLAMIRPRPGDFVWTADEVAVMEHEVVTVRRAGLAGVVIGASHPDGRLNLGVLARLLRAAEGMDVTLHRAFDRVPDQAEALEEAISLRIPRILTSGGAPSAPEAAERLAALHAQAAGRIALLPGAGITADTVGAVLAAAPFAEVHASCARPVAQAPQALRLGLQDTTRMETHEAEVRRLRAALDAFAAD